MDKCKIGKTCQIGQSYEIRDWKVDNWKNVKIINRNQWETKDIYDKIIK